MLLAIQETLKIGETISGEGRRCEKAGEALRYALISAQEMHKMGGRSMRRWEPWRKRRREPATIFKVIFQGLFLEFFFSRHVFGILWGSKNVF